MPRRSVPLVVGVHYHVYNRGHNRQPIFFERENYVFFLRRLRQYLLGAEASSHTPGDRPHPPPEAPSAIVAYCLMPNHFHLLVQPHDDQLSRRMQRLSISYTKALNKRYGRTGALYEGQFQAAHVDRDEYLLHLSRYIHRNPVEAGLVQNPEDWEFSSYREYVGLRQGTLPAPGVVLSQFSSPIAYREFVESYGPDRCQLIAHLSFEDD